VNYDGYLSDGFDVYDSSRCVPQFLWNLAQE
jgi:hypothetical protein